MFIFKAVVSLRSFRNVFSLVVVAMLALHALIAISMVFLSPSKVGNALGLPQTYRYFVHLGPFYREESIRSSPHFIITIGKDSIDAIDAYQQEYFRKPYLFSSLTLRDYVRKNADVFAKKKKVNSRAYKNLLMVTRDRMSSVVIGDTVRWRYFHRHTKEDGRIEDKTIFSCSFFYKDGVQ